MMIAAKRISLLPTAGLIDTAVHVEINVTDSFHFALHEGIGVKNIDELGVAFVQFLIVAHGHEEGHGRIQTRDSGQLVGL